MTYETLWFDSGGVACDAWYFRASGDRYSGPQGKPAVVMAHGLGGTKDSGLQGFADRFAGAGLHVLAFDYRGFGSSDGQPRQSVSVARQLDDYRAAVAAARRLPDVDPNRIVLWGVSFSGGHVLRVAAGSEVAAVIALTPLTSGLATARLAVAQRDLPSALRWAVVGLRSRVSAAVGGDPVSMPVVGRPGEPGALTLDGAYENYLAMAGPTWRNEIDTSVSLQLPLISVGRMARRIRCPLLVQIADFDRFVPADSVARTAVRGRAYVHHYPCDHFDVWPGHHWFDKVVAHQLAFVSRSLVRHQVPTTE